MMGGFWASLSKGKRAAVIAIGAALLLATALWVASILLRPSPPSHKEIVAKMQTQAALTGGAKAYAAHCAYCHETGIGPSIAGRDLPAEAVQSFVRMGPGAMPAFPASQVSDTDIKALAAYINALPVKTEPKK